MKNFEPFVFDKAAYDGELNAFEKLLTKSNILNEQTEILPFFRQNRQIAAKIGLFFPHIHQVDTIAYEYDLWGDFACDLVVGDTKNAAYYFIEFEDAKQNSIFVNKQKYKPEFAPRLEHGCSQIIDWLYHLRHASPYDLKERFGKDKIKYEAMLIIGRSQFLNNNQRERLEWRAENLKVDSKGILILTFDDLLNILQSKQPFS